MAVATTVNTQTITTISETAADEIIIRRTSVKNPNTGLIDIIFSASILYSTREYQGTDSNNRTDVIRITDSGNINLSIEQVVSLFGISLTLPNTTSKQLGDFLGDEVDKLIAEDLITRVKNKIKPNLSIIAGPAANMAIVTVLNQPDATYEWSVTGGEATLSGITANSVEVSPVTKPVILQCKASYTKDITISEITTMEIS